MITQKPIRGFKIQKSHELVSGSSPLLNYPVADSTLSTIINHTKKLLHTDLYLLVRIAQLITLGEWLILLDIASIRLSSRTYLFSSKKVSKSHFSKVLISYIYDIEIFTSNDTSLKRREKVSLMSHRSIIKEGTDARKESNQRTKRG